MLAGPRNADYITKGIEPAYSGRSKRAGTSPCACLHTHEILTRGRTIFRRATKNGPAFP